MTEGQAGAKEGRLSGASASAKLSGAEDGLNVAILVAMSTLPLADFILRFFSTNVPGALRWVSVLTMAIGFTGGMLAARQGKHLSLSTGEVLPERLRGVASMLGAVIALVTCVVLAYGAYEVVEVEAEFTATLPPGVPGWVPLAIMPIAYGVIGIRLVLHGLPGWSARGGAALAAAIVLGGLYALGPENGAFLFWPTLLALLLAVALGAPIFVGLGGLGLALFWFDFEPIAAVAAETVRLTKSDTVPTIPLFTFTGYILAESRASERLIRAFRALFGWMPGGLAVMTALVCAFFTTFTGASGVTILALGGLLYPVLSAERYREEFSVGLLTASGSIGLLFPPSLPIILYGVIAQVPIDKMFIAGIIPGVVLVAAVCVLGVKAGLRPEVARRPFEFAEARAAVWEAKWEFALPLVVVGSIFSGFAILIEAAALTAAYALFVAVVIHRDLRLKDLGRVGRECATLVGGVLIILGVAMGLTNYMVDAEIPNRALEWVKSGIESKLVFLAVLNLFLLVVGCLMDIYSAIVVVVPLILPIGAYFGIHPIHLGIIFLANLELGFLTPPVGMNLFLSSFRFEKPLTRVYRSALPFLGILAIAVVLITYVPALTLEPVRWVFGEESAPPPKLDGGGLDIDLEEELDSGGDTSQEPLDIDVEEELDSGGDTPQKPLDIDLEEELQLDDFDDESE